MQPIHFLHPLSEGRGTRLTIRNKNPKNSDCEMSWLVYDDADDSDNDDGHDDDCWEKHCFVEELLPYF